MKSGDPADREKLKSILAKHVPKETVDAAFSGQQNDAQAEEKLAQANAEARTAGKSRSAAPPKFKLTKEMRREMAAREAVDRKKLPDY